MLETIPALVKLAILFVFIIVCIRKKISLGTTFLSGGIFSGIIFGLEPVAIIRTFIVSICSPKTIALSLVVTLILVLSNSMEKTGQMQSLLSHFKGLLTSSRLNVIVFPAIIGLLPMPGGAVFSAPMVKEIGSHLEYSPKKLSFINYWFRHIWEYWWPMYPGILLIPAITDINLNILMIHFFPLTIFALGIGYLFLKGDKRKLEHIKKPALKPFLWDLIPIIIAVFPGLLAGTLLNKVFPWFPVGREAGLILALVCSIAWVWKVNRLGRKKIGQLFDTQMVKMAYMIVAILLFKEILEQSKAVGGIADELSALNIPVVVVVALLPFLTGLITGISVAFVGSAFPIIVHMIDKGESTLYLLPYVELAMVCGFCGVLLSPVHLCLILSNEYFDVAMDKVYPLLGRACFLLIFGGFIYFYFLKAVI